MGAARARRGAFEEGRWRWRQWRRGSCETVAASRRRRDIERFSMINIGHGTMVIGDRKGSGTSQSSRITLRVHAGRDTLGICIQIFFACLDKLLL